MSQKLREIQQSDPQVIYTKDVLIEIMNTFVKCYQTCTYELR